MFVLVFGANLYEYIQIYIGIINNLNLQCVKAGFPANPPAVLLVVQFHSSASRLHHRSQRELLHRLKLLRIIMILLDAS